MKSAIVISPQAVECKQISAFDRKMLEDLQDAARRSKTQRKHSVVIVHPEGMEAPFVDFER
jgi:hypothetical protein